MLTSKIRTTVLLVIAWLILLGLLSIRGFFANFSALPPRLTLALLTPLPVVLLFLRSRAGKQLLQRVEPQWVIYLQTFRVILEVAILLLVRRGTLPVQMSLEGRNFDILIGLLALPVGYYCFVKRSWPRAVVALYNIAGLISLVNVVVIATLSMPTPLRIFTNQPDTSILTRFPLIYVPGLMVPLAYTLHIISLRQLRLPSVIKSSPMIPVAKEWFAAGSRLPYDPMTKRIGSGAAPLFVFNKYVYSAGNPDVILSFLPGFPTGSYDWSKIDVLLEEQHSLNRLYVEYIGQGESDKPEGYLYSTFERADLVEAIWKHHRIESTIVVTFDYSSLVVMELLRRQQEKKLWTVIKGVLLINGGYFADGHSHPIFTTPLLKTSLGKRSAIKAQTSDVTFNRMLKGMWSRQYRVTDAELAEVRDAVRRRNGVSFLHYAAGFVDEHKANGERLNLLPIVEKMHRDVRFSIVGSDKDQFEPKQVALARKRLSKYGVDVEVAPGGHMITMERPEWVVGKILKMIREEKVSLFHEHPGPLG
ncbi:MAG TPA: alpha/beta hydrolase [Puia sp.]|nr:alpha/beta hydrolase [Puia sp.]